MDLTTYPSRWLLGCSASTGSAFRAARLDADGVDQLIDADMDRDSESKRSNELAGSGTIEKAKRKETAGHGIGLVHHVLKPAGSGRAGARSDAELPLDEAIRQLGQAIGKSTQGTHQPSVDPGRLQHVERARPAVPPRQRRLRPARQRGQASHQRDASPRLVLSEHRPAAQASAVVDRHY